MPLAIRFGELLADAGVVRGLIGPREVARLWDRHLLNCAVLTDLLPVGARIVDVGTGAGLPGLVLACRRADLRVDLVESLQRRVDFLNEAVTALELADRVRVIHGRAEDRLVITQTGNAPFVTARAVAPLDRLARWCLPLVAPGGALLAMKGEQAGEEISLHRAAVNRAGAASIELVRVGTDLIAEPVTIVRVLKRGR